MGGRRWVVRVVVPPFLILAAVAFYLYTHWDQIPLRFPVHWSATGVPNRWTMRNWRGVFGPLIAGGIVTAMMLSQCAALRFGTRPGRARSVALTCLVAIAYVLCFSFSMAPILFVTKLPVWLIPVIAIGTIAVVLVWAIVQMRRPGSKAPEPAPGDLFVPKRSGMGYSLNFANPWSWVLLAGPLVLIPAIIFVLP